MALRPGYDTVAPFTLDQLATQWVPDDSELYPRMEWHLRENLDPPLRRLWDDLSGGRVQVLKGDDVRDERLIEHPDGSLRWSNGDHFHSRTTIVRTPSISACTEHYWNPDWVHRLNRDHWVEVDPAYFALHNIESVSIYIRLFSAEKNVYVYTPGFYEQEPHARIGYYSERTHVDVHKRIENVDGSIRLYAPKIEVNHPRRDGLRLHLGLPLGHAV
jgi:hypothetical protein